MQIQSVAPISSFQEQNPTQYMIKFCDDFSFCTPSPPVLLDIKIDTLVNILLVRCLQNKLFIIIFSFEWSVSAFPLLHDPSLTCTEPQYKMVYLQVAKKRSLYQRAWAAHPVPNGKRMSSVDRGETIENTQEAEDVQDSKEETGSGGDDDGGEKGSPVPSAPPAEELIEES